MCLKADCQSYRQGLKTSLSQLAACLKDSNESTNGTLETQPLCQGSVNTAIAVWILRPSVLMLNIWKKKEGQNHLFRFASFDGI